MRFSLSPWLKSIVVTTIFLATTNVAARAQTLDAVRERGFLICASTNSLPGFSQQNEEGFWSGFDVDFCRAVSAAIFGNPDLVEFRSLEGQARFADLQTGNIDLLARGAFWSLERDIANQVNFVASSFYDGQAFMIADESGVVSAVGLNDISVCIVDDENEVKTVDAFFFENQNQYNYVRYEEREDLAVAFAAGLCDVVSAPARWLHALRGDLPEPAKFRILPDRISKEPFGPIIRGGDAEWADIIRWTFFALVNAEELGITAQNLETMREVKARPVQRFLGSDPDFDFGAILGLSPDWMMNVVGAVGNYGEMYERNFGSQTGVALPRGLNSLWSQGGLIYAPPVI